MDIDSMRTFQAVARDGSFTRAASRLHLSQPAVSLRINLLERQVGRPLFERAGRKIRLTPEGETFVAFVDELLSRYELGMRAVREVATKQRPVLTVGSTTIGGTYVLPDILAAFEQEGAAANVVVRTGPSSHTAAMLMEGTVDVGIVSVYHSMQYAHLKLITLREDPVRLVVPPGHRLASREEISMADLKGIPLISYDPVLAIRSQLDEIFERAGVAFETALQVDNLEAIKHFVRKGLGLAVLPELVIADELRNDTLVSVRTYPELPPLPTSIAYRQRANLPEAVYAFRDAALRATGHEVRPRRPASVKGKSPKGIHKD